MDRDVLALLQRVGGSEEHRAHQCVRWPPVAEDHGRDANETAALGLAFLVDPGLHDDDESPRQPGERTRDERTCIPHLDHRDTKRVGSDGMLARCPQPKTESSTPQDEGSRRNQGQCKQRQQWRPR